MTDVLQKLAEAIRREEEHDVDWLVKATTQSLEAVDAKSGRGDNPAEKLGGTTAGPLATISSSPSSPRLQPKPAAPAKRGRFALAAGLLLAAGIAAALITTRLPAPLPPYVAELAGGEAPTLSVRPSPTGSLALGPDSHLTLTLRPAKEVEGPISVRAFLVRTGETRRFEAPFLMTDKGTVRLTGRTADIFRDVPPGTWEMVVCVGREGNLPEEARDADSAAARSDDRVRVMRMAIVLDPAAP